MSSSSLSSTTTSVLCVRATADDDDDDAVVCLSGGASGCGSQEGSCDLTTFVADEEVAPAAADGTLGVEIGEDAHRQGIAKDLVIISSDEDSYDDQVIMVDDDDGPGVVVVGDECSEPEAERGRDHLRRTGFLDDIAGNPVGIREPSPRPRKSEKRRHGALPGTEPTTWTARQDQHLRLACKNEIRESAVTSILDPNDKELLRMALSLIHGKTLGEAIQRAEHLQLLTRDQLVHLSR